MVHVNNNNKLANLLEKLLSKDIDEETKINTKDLIIELRSNRPEIVLVEGHEYEHIR